MRKFNGLFGFVACAVVGSVATGPAAIILGQEFVPPGQSVAMAESRVVHLTLDEARQAALNNNKSLGLARLNVDEKGFASSAAEKDYFPKVMGSVSYFHFDRPLGSVLTTRGGNTINVDVANQNAALSTVFIAQPITKLIAVNAAVQASRADECIAQAKLDGATKDLLSGVTQAYFGLIGAQRIQTALQLQATMLEQQVAKTPAPQLQISLIELRQGLLQTQSQVREVTDQLNDLLGFAPGTMLELADPIPPAPPVQSAEQAVGMALTCNTEIREAEQNIVKAEAGVQLSRMAYLPDVSVIGGYANQTSASYIQPDIGYLGISASYTAWEWGKKHELVCESETTLSLAHQNLLVTRDKVQLAARKTYGDFDDALRAARLAEQMVRACTDAEKGAAGPEAIMTAKGATAKAQLELMKADIAYRVAHAQLSRTIGNE